MSAGSWPLRPENPETATVFAAVHREIEEYRALATTPGSERTDMTTKPELHIYQPDFDQHDADGRAWTRGGYRPATRAEVVAALIAEGGEIRQSGVVARGVSAPLEDALHVDEPGRYLVYGPLPG